MPKRAKSNPKRCSTCTAKKSQSLVREHGDWLRDIRYLLGILLLLEKAGSMLKPLIEEALRLFN